MCAMALPSGFASSLTHSRQSPACRSLCTPHNIRPCHRSLSPQIACKARRTNKGGDDEPQVASPAVSLPLAALLAASIALGGATFPEDALAARSGGRVGGSSGFRSAPRSAPRAAPGPSRSSTRQYNNYYNYSAPPLTGGYGGYGLSPFSGFGGFGGGINIFPSFGVPIFGVGLGSGFFNLIIIAFVFSTVAGIVRSVLGNRRRDDFDDYD